MKNIFCWMCRTNIPYPLYDETHLLDEQGNKPCLECILEADAEEESEE